MLPESDAEDISREAASLLVRPDIEIHYFTDRGSAVNRNHAFDLARAPVPPARRRRPALQSRGATPGDRTHSTRTPDIEHSHIPRSNADPRIHPDTEHDLDIPFRFYTP